jgi:Tfp pilus assembly protein FimT
MVELMVIAATALVLAAITIPIVDLRLRQCRIGNAATSVANLIQRNRYEPIRALRGLQGRQLDNSRKERGSEYFL